MNKDVFAIFFFDEAEAFLLIEPFNLTFWHSLSPFLICKVGFISDKKKTTKRKAHGGSLCDFKMPVQL